jgi:hypothetical protein
MAMLFLRLHDHQTTAAEILWGAWLFPLALMLWLVIKGAAAQAVDDSASVASVG